MTKSLLGRSLARCRLKDLAPASTIDERDKVRLMQFLVAALAQEQDIPLLTTDTEYPIWTPWLAFDAADTPLQMLQTHQGEQ